MKDMTPPLPSIIDDLPEDIRTSFLAGYRGGADADDDALIRLAAEQADDRAFWDGHLLGGAIRLVRYSDTFTELRANEATYDEIAVSLNARYGEIVLLSADVEQGAFGLRAHRDPGVSSIETTERHPDGSVTHTVEDIAGKIAAEDAGFRESRPVDENSE